MASVDLVVTDLDGTLWHTDDELHPSTDAAMRELERRGVPLLVATGRRIASTRRPLARFGYSPPAVVLNGAVALDLATGARFHRHAFAPDQARQVLEAFVECGLSPCVYVDQDEIEVFVGPSPSTNQAHLEMLGQSAKTADLDEIVVSVPVLAFGIMGRPWELLEPAAALIEPIANPHLGRTLDFPGAAITVAPGDVSKWVGVLAFCKHANLDAQRILAIGDGPNDIELLSNADVAVVPADGAASVQALADHVVPPARVGGWASIMDLL